MTNAPAIRVRLAGPGDEERVAALAWSLSGDSARRRFMGVVAHDVAVAELRREVRGGAGEFAFIAEDAAGAIVGEAYAALLDGDRAEAAFVVADHSQHHGIGTLLFAAVVRELAARNVATMQIETLAQNIAMLRLVADSKLAYAQQRCEGGTVAIALRIPAAGAQPG